MLVGLALRFLALVTAAMCTMMVSQALTDALYVMVSQALTDALYVMVFRSTRPGERKPPTMKKKGAIEQEMQRRGAR